MDKELIILNAVERKESPTQRDLARSTGLSLGTINILIKKMIREGLIKLEKLPSNRASYILTPKGLDEKVTKTRAYINIHYNAIELLRKSVLLILENHKLSSSNTIVRIEQPELRELVFQCMDQMKDQAGDALGQRFILADHDDADALAGHNHINIHHYL